MTARYLWGFTPRPDGGKEHGTSPALFTPFYIRGSGKGHVTLKPDHHSASSQYSQHDITRSSHATQAFAISLDQPFSRVIFGCFPPLSVSLRWTTHDAAHKTKSVSPHLSPLASFTVPAYSMHRCLSSLTGSP